MKKRTHTEPVGNENGFTLLELIVTLSIVAALLGIAIPIFLNQQAKAKESALLADTRSAGALIEQAYAIGQPVSLVDGGIVTPENAVKSPQGDFTFPYANEAGGYYCVELQAYDKVANWTGGYGASLGSCGDAAAMYNLDPGAPIVEAAAAEGE